MPGKDNIQSHLLASPCSQWLGRIVFRRPDSCNSQIINNIDIKINMILNNIIISIIMLKDREQIFKALEQTILKEVNYVKSSPKYIHRKIIVLR